MGQLAPGRRKIEFLADVHNVCIASSTTWGTQVKVEHNLHRNVWKMGMNVPRKYPTFLRVLYEKGYYLNSLLEHSAHEAVSGLTLTSANYQVAISVLKRFGTQ